MRVRPVLPARQRGVLLIEVLIAIAIFAVGVLSMISVQAVSIAAQADSQYRAEAERLIDRLATDIRMEVAHDATTGNIDPLVFAGYNHLTTGTPADCSFSGTAGNATVTDWVRDVRGLDASNDPIPGRGLPGTAADRVQVVASSAGGLNQLRVTVCWQAPADRAPRRHSTVAYID